MASTFIIPPLESSGTFVFNEPFNNSMYSDKEYTVRGIRSLKELSDSEEQPYENIYATVGLDETAFKEDLDNNIPIVVLSDAAGKYFYIPATYLKSMPKTTGIKYQEVTLAINLGYLPIDYDLTLAKETIQADIQGTMGITSDVAELKTSTVRLVETTEDETFKALLEGNKTNTTSYRTKYYNLLNVYNSKVALIAQLEAALSRYLM